MINLPTETTDQRLARRGRLGEECNVRALQDGKNIGNSRLVATFARTWVRRVLAHVLVNVATIWNRYFFIRDISHFEYSTWA